jgi:uncharacterized LabA/DUF88 family protein
LPHHDRLNIAVFIDFDNIEIGVKSTLGQQFDVGTILDAIKERGEVVTKIAYADWTRAGEYSRTLTQHAIRLVQRNLTPGGDKNGADINLALDALEMAFTHPHINAYVIVGGDSDFLSLVEKLKQYDKKVFVVGGRAFTSVILQRNCHEFIAYENLHGVRKTAAKIGRPMPAAAANSPIAQAFSIVRRALKILADREVSPQTGLLKSTLLQLDSTFSERNYGASSFLDFVEKLSQAGLVQLKHAGRSVMVELNNQFDETEAGAAEKARLASGVEAMTESTGVMPPVSPAPAYPEPRRNDVGGAFRPSGDQASLPQPSSPGSFYGEPRRSDSGGGGFRPAQEQPTLDVPRATEPAADGVKRVADVLNAATTARWPMYLRNVKQLLRAADNAFDERRYGFSGLVELVRACQKDGLVRLERDRRGGLRVFPGPALQRGIDVATPRDVSSEVNGNQVNGNVQIETERPRPTERPAWEAAAAAAAESHEAGDADLLDNEPMPTSDPTAELLGTGARRKRVSRVPAAAPARRAAPKTAARKPAAPRRAAAGTRKSAAKSQV